MKPIKMLGLTVMAALLAMSFVGVSSAMAEGIALCKADESTCAKANQVSHVHETTTTKAILLGSSNPECDVLFLGAAVAEEDEEGNLFYGGSPLKILGNFTYSNCNGECTAKEESGLTEIQVLREGSQLAKVTSGTGTWAGLVNLVCTGFKISCRYVGEGLVGHGKGALSATNKKGKVSLSEQTTVEEGDKSLCPNTGKLDITTEPLTTTYAASYPGSSLASPAASLCKADEGSCAKANQASHVHETTLAEKPAVLLGSSNPECDVLFLGDVVVNEETGKYLNSPLTISGTFTYSNCNGECTVKEENGPTEIQVLRTGAELATVTSGTGSGAGLVNLVCTFFKISCKYVGSGLIGHALGALTSSQLNGSVTLSEQKVLEEGDKSLCPNTGKLDITTTPLIKTYLSG